MSARGLARRLASAVAGGWRALRLWSGDAAYDVYAARHRDGPRLSRAAFYLDALERRYRKPNRCC